MTSTDVADRFDLSDVLAEEARMLRERAPASARTVLLVIAMAAVVLLLQGLWKEAIVWSICTSAMAALTVVYARIYWRYGISEGQIRRYLRGHVFITGLTGLVWAGMAIYLSDPEAEIQTIIAGFFVTSITTGGAMAGTIYRPGYVALAVCSLLPFGAYLIITMHGTLQIFGLFVLAYFAFCYVTNEQASRKTQDAIAAGLGHDAMLEIVKQQEKITQLDAESRRLHAAIQHDMSQPLLAQRHLVSALAKITADPEQLRMIDRIQATQHSQEQLLAALSAETALSPTTSVSKESFDLHGLFAQLKAEFATSARQAGSQLHVSTSVDTLVTDRFAIERILRNLLTNAFKFQSGSGNVWLTATQQDSGVRIAVRDDGPGIPQADQRRIFEEYVRLPRDLDRPGKGLGLSICRRLATQLGGTLELASSFGEGTEIALLVPNYQTEQQTALTGKSCFLLAVGHAASPDLGDWGDLVSEWLWEFAHAGMPAEAERLIKALQLQPDVVLYDPKDAGDPDQLAALTKIAPVLFIQRDRVDWSLETAARVINAPFDFDTLQQAITETIYIKANARAR